MRASQESRKFGVDILGEDQGYIAERFASPWEERFAGLRPRILVRSISLDDSLDLQALAAEFNVLLPENGGRLAATGGRPQSGSMLGFSPGRLRPCRTGAPLVV
jgi:hypothetical protein